MVGIVSYWQERWWVLELVGMVSLPGVISGAVGASLWMLTGNFWVSVLVAGALLFFLTPPFEEEAVRFLNKRTRGIAREKVSSVQSSIQDVVRSVKEERPENDPERRELEELLRKFRRYGPEALTCNEFMRLKYLLGKYRPGDEDVLLLAMYAVGMLVGYRCFGKGSKT
ncbi:hypothetical membrane protein [Thermococcus kodakarensis KOD1]|uniref:Hypothetical membrane protein n=1 Tax=Thermococcus kodakarensis (strain ATCC BAA-918 / JCM 12380 / KOD1) TaxID=69014 RepID=Q5JGY0_THEKO|nr:hypothetical protein [Thermococcus kodakarensis]WCN27354.1 hypothetical protein POG15_06985 [Thermococcus kodakarensis]WCN29643.1 hypothetical protein POG21_06980 [Thermococcus kodakarensis]BAD85564.1 hypothetical membrane protein [Thermococcus kodakarensis KOD1]